MRDLTTINAQWIKVGGAVKVTAEVVAIDRVDRIVALLGPRGNVVEVWWSISQRVG